MKSQASEMNAVWTVRSAAPAIRYQPETSRTVSQSPTIQPHTSTPSTSSATRISAAATIQPATFAIRRRREWSPIGLTAFAADATALIGVLLSAEGACTRSDYSAHATPRVWWDDGACRLQSAGTCG